MNTIAQSSGLVYPRIPQRSLATPPPFTGLKPEIKPLRAYSTGRRIAIVTWLLLATSLAAMAATGAFSTKAPGTAPLAKVVSVGCG